MLSPQAARMGSVQRCLGRFLVGGRASSSVFRSTSRTLFPRFKSTLALQTDPDYSHAGHVSAMEQKAQKSTIQEPWMVNLGRNNDDQWLLQPRPSEWFTGVSPKAECPGTCSKNTACTAPVD